MTGYAGTGKTTLLQLFIRNLRDRGDKRSIVLSAFSNKATKVLKAMADQWGLEIDAMTCCKLLGLRPVINEEDGKQVFQPDRKQASQIGPLPPGNCGRNAPWSTKSCGSCL